MKTSCLFAQEQEWSCGYDTFPVTEFSSLCREYGFPSLCRAMISLQAPTIYPTFCLDSPSPKETIMAPRLLNHAGMMSVFTSF